MAASVAWEPEWVVSPGEVLAEALEDGEMSQSELARRMGRPVKTVNEIINGKAAITPETALGLELVLGISASLWTGMEATYRQRLARHRVTDSFASWADWLRQFPRRDLEAHGLLDTNQPVGGQVAQLLRFFAVGSPEVWESRWATPAVEFRASTAYSGSVHSRAAWLRWGEHIAAGLELNEFNASALERQVVTELRPLTRFVPFVAAVDRARQLLAQCGVALVVLPELTGTRLSGAAHWPSSQRPIVQLSLRYKTEDQFWFSCMHEIAHVLDEPRVTFLDGDTTGDEDDPREARANLFARSALIDPEAYQAFVTHGIYTATAVRSFASEQRVAPGVLVGRLQRDKHLRSNQLNQLKRSVDFQGAA